MSDSLLNSTRATTAQVHTDLLHSWWEGKAMPNCHIYSTESLITTDGVLIGKWEVAREVRDGPD